jgi:thiamine-monophosphate kinase
MGAKPRAALLSLIVPADLDDEAVYGIVRGVAAAADEHAAPVIGGNLARGSEVSITTTVIGEVGSSFMRRAGARVGDGVYLTGPVGLSALGIAALRKGKGDDPRHAPFVDRHRRPIAHTVTGQRLVAIATACADVSDGLVADLRHVCDASNVGARIYARELPRVVGFDSVARDLGEDPLALALAGGEDYELVFTAPADVSADELGTRIGEIVVGSGVSVIAPTGEPIDLGRGGFSHF